MTNSAAAECKSYSCEEYSGTHDEFIGYIHKVTMGSEQTLLRRGKEDKTVTGTVCIFIFRNVKKKQREKLTEMIRQLHNTIKAVVYAKGE